MSLSPGEADSLMTARGEFLRNTLVNTEIQLMLFRNDESEEFPIFEIQILLQGHVFTLEQFRCSEKRAFKDYKKILKKLRNSKK